MKNGIIINGVSYAVKKTSNLDVDTCTLCDLRRRCKHHSVPYALCGADGGWGDQLRFIYFKKE